MCTSNNFRWIMCKLCCFQVNIYFWSFWFPQVEKWGIVSVRVGSGEQLSGNAGCGTISTFSVKTDNIAWEIIAAWRLHVNIIIDMLYMNGENRHRETSTRSVWMRFFTAEHKHCYNILVVHAILIFLLYIARAVDDILVLYVYFT